MFVINARNVNEALRKGIELIKCVGEVVESRNGPTFEVPCPVATVYRHPWERVLISKVRDANPFFHLMESLWILAGRFDVKFLAEFNKRMADYSDDGLEFNAAYGYRMRVCVSADEWHSAEPVDQVVRVIDLLKEDPLTRQAVIQIWDSNDLTKITKDKACNMSAVFRIRDGKLCLTVYNRSNDMLWGAYGANVVQFSMLQEYVAAHLGLPLGEYTQITNSYHVYATGPGGELWERLNSAYERDLWGQISDKPISDIYDQFAEHVYMNQRDMDLGNFQHDMELLFNTYDEFGLKEVGELNCWRSEYFICLVLPVLCVFLVHKEHGPNEARKHLGAIKDDAWKLACKYWLENRAK